jgi:hypothetical protein
MMNVMSLRAIWMPDAATMNALGPKVIDSYARMLQSVEFEARLIKLEQATEK